MKIIRKQITMIDKQIIGGRGSAKSFTTLNTVEVLLENEKLKEALKRKKQECERLKDIADHNGRICNKRLDKIDELEHDINELNGQLDPLKATLTEIKTIALTPICVMRIAEREEFGDAEWSELRGKTIIARQILQIISEYEEKENE